MEIKLPPTGPREYGGSQLDLRSKTGMTLCAVAGAAADGTTAVDLMQARVS